MTPTLLRTRNLEVRIYPKDHDPPHVHVVGPEAEAKFRLKDLECVYSRGFSRKALKQIKKFLSSRKDFLQEAWDDFQN